MRKFTLHLIKISILLAAAVGAIAQTAPRPGSAAGSLTARNGFRNETEIAEKFKQWETDTDARTWLSFMGYKPERIATVAAYKPHGEKADIEVRVNTLDRETRTDGISIKLVSTARGFNQIDKRWLSHYVEMWDMPKDVEAALSLFVGETPPRSPGRAAGRMFLNELTLAERKAVVDFFTANKKRVLADLFSGDGDHRAAWIMVAQKSGGTRWVLRSIEHAIKFYGEGPVVITPQGNLKIGRVTMQRKGGDAGRDTAKMLQFKIDPTLLF
jgi:hypothetical protein